MRIADVREGVRYNLNGELVEVTRIQVDAQSVRRSKVHFRTLKAKHPKSRQPGDAGMIGMANFASWAIPPTSTPKRAARRRPTR